MLWLYRFLFLPALLVILPAYLRRMFRRGGFREKFFTRFGAVGRLPVKRPGARRIWVQAVSVGEMMAIGPLLDALRAPGDVEIYLTTTTTTGFAVARERYMKSVIGLGYFPMDFWPCAAHAWRKLSPDLAILTEGERWPEFIHQAKRRGVPVVCVNARMSDRSFRRLTRLRWIVRALLGGITRILACSQQDGRRFAELGFPADRISVTGNIKFDVPIVAMNVVERHALKRELGLAGGLLILGSSTWPGEELALVQACRAARESGIACALLIVPRHAERRAEITALLDAKGLSHHLRSHGVAPGLVDVAVGDTTGELRRFTQLADVVFVGKSLPPHAEGQTPVDAAALGKPVLFGPGMSNFREIVTGLMMNGGARTVEQSADLQSNVVELLQDEMQRAVMSAAALQWHETNRGAIARSVEAIRETLATRVGA